MKHLAPVLCTHPLSSKVNVVLQKEEFESCQQLLSWQSPHTLILGLADSAALHIFSKHAMQQTAAHQHLEVPVAVISGLQM